VTDPAARWGSYEYLLNGEATEVNETWELLGDSAGECQASSRRTAPGVLIEVEAHLSSGQVTWFEVMWQSDDSPAICALYKLRGDALIVSRRQGNETLEEEEILFVEDESPPLLFPLMRIFTGPLISTLLEQGGEGSVAIPSIADPANMTQLLQPKITNRQARILDEQAVLSRDGTGISCRCCEYSGDQYGPGSRFWLDEENLLLRYQWQQAEDQRWDVWLNPR